MFRLIKNNDGIALLMVLVLLILVGGLTASLMAAGVFNIRFGGDEVEKNQAFYAADAGVEYTKNAAKTSGFFSDLNVDDRINGNENIKINNSDNQELIEFFVEVEEISENKVTFISNGKTIDNSRNTSIKFEIPRPSHGLNNLNINNDHDIDDEDHYNITGGGEEELIKKISIIDWDFNTFEDFHNHFVDFEGEGKKSLSQINQDNYENDELDFDYSQSGNSSGFSIDKNIEGRNLYIDDNLSIEAQGNKDYKIKDSIVIVDGALDLNLSAGFHIENSVFIVKDHFELKGSSPSEPWTNPLFLVYGENDIKSTYLDIRGTGNFEIDFEDFTKLPIEFNLDDINSSTDIDVQNWRVIQ
ncbi:MAG: PilX N-terminal domain-containing pilus assembly protein [Bacillota bacterium]